MSKFFENKNPFQDFSLKWFLCEGCLKRKFQPNRFLNVRFLYAGFYCTYFKRPFFNGSSPLTPIHVSHKVRQGNFNEGKFFLHKLGVLILNTTSLQCIFFLEWWVIQTSHPLLFQKSTTVNFGGGMVYQKITVLFKGNLGCWRELTLSCSK